jgi:hypothetical protein
VRELLDKQRHAVTPRRDFLRIVDGDLIGCGGQRQLPGLGVRQLAEADVQRLVAVPHPRQTRSCRPQDQQARSDGGRSHAVQQLQRGRVRPMEILEHHHDRLIRRRGADHVDEPLEQQLPQLDRRQLDDRKVIGRFQVQYDAQGRDDLGWVDWEICQRRLQPGQPLGAGPIRTHVRVPLDRRADRVQRAGHAVRRAVHLEDPGTGLDDALHDSRGQPGLSDAWLSRDEDKRRLARLADALTVPLRGGHPVPQVEHPLELGVAADERQRCRAQRPRPPGWIASSDHPVDLDRRVDALQLHRPEWLGVEPPGHQFVGRGADEDGVGVRQSLQARRSVQGQAEYADAVDHHDAGIYSDPGVQRDAQLGLQPGSDRAQSGQYVQPRGNRSARVVLMSEGVAETGDDRVALHVDELALVLLDNRPTCQLERTQHAAIDLDVVALGERRGLDEIDEQGRRLAAAGKRTPAAMTICQGAEHGGLGVVGLKCENVGGQRVHLTPVEPLEGSLGHREQLFGSEVRHRPLSPRSVVPHRASSRGISHTGGPQDRRPGGHVPDGLAPEREPVVDQVLGAVRGVAELGGRALPELGVLLHASGRQTYQITPFVLAAVEPVSVHAVSLPRSAAAALPTTDPATVPSAASFLPSRR